MRNPAQVCLVIAFFLIVSLVTASAAHAQATNPSLATYAVGPRTPFSIKLPMAPKKVELDPELWVLSENTSTKQVK
ncbi:MAG: hypothetical protein ABIP81_04925 [Terriglobales bacterium]